MSILSEILLSGCMINSTFRRRTHLVQSFSVVFLYCYKLCCGFNMASSSGTSSGSSQLQNSGSEEDLQALMDQRKRKRMISNRESARRSRMRKQKHLDELVAQVAQLRKENHQISQSVNITTQHCMNIESENSILRAQAGELSHRLRALNDIINFLNANTGVFGAAVVGDSSTFCPESIDSFMNPLSLSYLNQPITAATGIFNQY
nr:bzip transcription factor 44 [Quercus suber]